MENKYKINWSIKVEETRHKDIEIIRCYINQNGTKSDFSFAFSYHALNRCQERKVTKETIALALVCSTVIPKQGVLFHVVSPKLIPSSVGRQLHHQLKNLVVVTDTACSCVITAYYTPNGLRKTHKKSKIYCEQLSSAYRRLNEVCSN